MTKKIICLLLALLMLTSCFTACKKDDKDEKDKDVAASVFNKLSDKEKLLYFSGIPKEGEYVSKYEALTGDKFTMPTVPAMPEGDAYKAWLNADISKLEIDGQSMLQSLGGKLGLDVDLITDGTDASIDAGVKAGPLSIKFNAIKEDKGLYFNAPFIFKQPVKVDLAALEGMMEGSANAQAIITAFDTAVEKMTEYAEKNLTKENLKYFQDVLMDLIPEKCITVDKEKLKDEYIGTSFDTDCVTLALSGEDMVTILKSLRGKLYEDAKFKGLFVGLVECAEDVSGAFVFTTGDDEEAPDADKIYDDFFESIDELVKEIEEDKDNNALTIKRYFVKGTDVRFEMEAKTVDSTASFAFYDIYANDSNSYGFTVGESEQVLMAVEGGNKADSATLSAVVWGQTEEAYDEESVMPVSALQDKGDYEKVMDLKLERSGDKMTFDGVMSADDNGITVKVVDNKFTLTMVDEGSDLDLKLDGNFTNDDNKCVIDCDATVTSEGEETKLDFTLSCEKLVSETSFELKSDIVVALKSGKNTIGMAFGFEVGYGTTDEKPAKADQSIDYYVIESDEDFEGLGDLLTDTVKQLLGSFTENI